MGRALTDRKQRSQVRRPLVDPPWARRRDSAIQACALRGRTSVNAGPAQAAHAVPAEAAPDAAVLDLYGVEPGLREQYWQLARAGRERGWWHKYRDVITDNLSTFVAFEAEAQVLHTWSWGAITGLLQTPEYARAIFASDPRWQTPEEIDRLVSARMARQGRMTGGDLDLWVVLDESLLRRQIGGPAVLADQLDRLATPEQGVTVQVLPQSVVWHPGLNGAFTVMQFPEHPTIAFAEALTGDLHVERESEVARYTVAFDHLRAAAASPEESRAHIVKARDALKKEG